MNNQENNYAYIDGANLYNGVGTLGWDLDYQRFRIWLSEKYGVKTAYLFIGLIPRYYENKFNKAIVVSSDGDYASLVKFLQERRGLKTILSPHTQRLLLI